MVTSKLHEITLKQFISKLENEGYKVIDLERKCPDAIAVKDNKIYAVEVLGQQYKKGRGWKNKFTFTQKRFIYRMFEDVLFKTFKYPKKNESVEGVAEKIE